MKRKTNWAWSKTKREFKAQCRAIRAPCHLCHMPIDYHAPPLSKNAFEVDHYHPVSVRPDLEYQLSNLRPSHCSCNRSRQAAPIKAAPWQAADW